MPVYGVFLSWGVLGLWFEFRASFKDFPTLRQPKKGLYPQCNAILPAF